MFSSFFEPHAQPVVLSREKGGLHLLLMGIWPDTASRLSVDGRRTEAPPPRARRPCCLGSGLIKYKR